MMKAKAMGVEVMMPWSVLEQLLLLMLTTKTMTAKATLIEPTQEVCRASGERTHPSLPLSTSTAPKHMPAMLLSTS